MRPVVTLAAALLLAAPAVAGPDADDAVQPPREALLLFVASWCAPCHGEVRALPEIAAVAAPMRVFVVPTDDTRGTQRMMRNVPADRRWRLAPAVAVGAMRRLAGGAPGLPISVAIDARGKVCAVSRKPVSVEIATAVRARCGVGR